MSWLTKATWKLEQSKKSTCYPVLNRQNNLLKSRCVIQHEVLTNYIAVPTEASMLKRGTNIAGTCVSVFSVISPDERFTTLLI